MRQLRWKSKYLTGVADTDNRKRTLIKILNEQVVESSQIEHCQDLTDLHHHFARLVETMLSQAKSSLDKYEDEIRQLLSMELPLPARDGSACRDCSQCDILQERTTKWLNAAS